jgi:flagellar biogenesis protein FliO
MGLVENQDAKLGPVAPAAGGLAGWLLARLRRGVRERPRLALVERIALAPRQSLALVEAEGRRFLVVTSADGTAAFYPLDEPAAKSAFRPSPPQAVTQKRPRVSW